MDKRYKIITLCGSIKFKKQFLIEQQRLTLMGNIVLVPNFLDQNPPPIITPNLKNMLCEMHKQKIDLCDEIFVINKNGYIGESTKSEIEYAIKQNKPVKYLE